MSIFDKIHIQKHLIFMEETLSIITVITVVLAPIIWLIITLIKNK